MAASDTRKMLGSVPLFEGLSNKELDAIAEVGKEIEHPSGHVIVEEGTTGGVGFHLILDGIAKVTVGDKERATLSAGDYFGEMALIEEAPRSASVTAEGPLRTLVISSWAFLPLLDKHPSIARKLLVEMSRRLRRVEKTVFE